MQAKAHMQYITVQSFWMFVAGLVVGALLILGATMMSSSEDGQTRLLKNLNLNKVEQVKPVMMQDAAKAGQETMTSKDSLGSVEGLSPHGSAEGLSPHGSVEGLSPHGSVEGLSPHGSVK